MNAQREKHSGKSTKEMEECMDVLKRTWIDASNMDETQAVSVPTATLKTCVHLTKLNEEDGWGHDTSHKLTKVTPNSGIQWEERGEISEKENMMSIAIGEWERETKGKDFRWNSAITFVKVVCQQLIVNLWNKMSFPDFQQYCDSYQLDRSQAT